MTRLVPTTRHRYLPDSARANALGYEPVVGVAGEAPLARADLGGHAEALVDNGARVLARVLHASDLHVLDPGSPARFDWIEAMGFRDAKWWPLLHAVRPSDVLGNWGVAAMADALRVDGSEIADFAVFTGDCIDNAQRNELDAYLCIVDGGEFFFDYEGPQRGTWAEDTRADDLRIDGLWPFWLPGAEQPDWFAARGFPTLPSLLDDAATPIRSVGIGMPWLAAVGNHDVLRAGTVRTEAAIEEIAVGSQRSLFVPGNNPVDPMAAFLDDASSFCRGGVSRRVRPDERRRGVRRGELVEEHRRRGHGFSGAVLSGQGAGDYVHDTEHVRFVVLDTTHPAGHYEGSVGEEQLEWLDLTLRGSGDRPVVVVSHHGGTSLDNTFANPSPTDRRCAADLEAVLHRSGRVVAWLAGHRHRNSVRAVRDPSGAGPGFWELSTSSLIDWPHQVRLVEIIAGSDASIGVRSTMLDHDADDVRGDDLRVRHAALHRELSWNLMRVTAQTSTAGEAGDRNVVLARA